MRRDSNIGAWVALVAALVAVPASAGARLEYRGRVLSEPRVQSLLETALRTPGDSVALSGGLENVVGSLEDLGYLDARAHGTWDQGSLRVTVSEGSRYTFRSIVIHAVPAEDSARIARVLEIAPGKVASPTAVGAALERAVTALNAEGFPYAELDVGEWTPKDAGVRLSISGVLGPRVIVSDVRIDGLAVTRPEVARRAMGKLAGAPYDPASASAARDRLAQLGLFRSVSWEGLEGQGDWSRGRLVYRVEESRYNRFEGAVGSQGQGDVVGLAHVAMDNLLGTGRSAELKWDSPGRGLSDLTARYVEPMLFGTPLRLDLGLTQELRDTLYTRTRWGARLGFVLSSVEYLEGGFEGEHVVQGKTAAIESQLANTVFAFQHQALDDVLAPRRGLRIRLDATQTFQLFGAPVDGHTSAKASGATIDAEAIRPLRASSGLSLEVEAAGRMSSQRVLPVYQRYPVGGAASLRGHDEEEFRVDRYALTRLEWRFYLGTARQRVYTFWDHAWMATRTAPAPGEEHLDTTQADGYGAGLRLETGSGIVGLDYGLAPGLPPSEGKIHLRLISTF